MGLLQSFLNLEATAGNIATAMTIVTLIALAGRIINMQYLHPLSKFPGPWWATSFSISLALISVLGMEHHFLLRLYKKYGNGAYKGPIRISPTMLLFPHPSALREIYRDPRLNTKTGVYGSGTIGTPESLFEIIDGEEHKALRKALSNAPWTIGQLKNQWEPRFDAHILLFLEKMREHASANRVICLSDKVAEFSADILSMISFGEAFGCVKNQRDEKRIVENWRKGLYAFGFVTRWRFLRDVIIPRTALGKWLLPKAAEEDGMGWLMKEADRQVTERERMATEKGGCEGQKDFLQQ
jgi:cytochrome P450